MLMIAMVTAATLRLLLCFIFIKLSLPKMLPTKASLLAYVFDQTILC